MRYAQRGGSTPAEQQRRERLRLQAAERFARGDAVGEIAHDLRVTEGSVRRWRKAWRDGGAEVLDGDNYIVTSTQRLRAVRQEGLGGLRPALGPWLPYRFGSEEALTRMVLATTRW